MKLNKLVVQGFKSVKGEESLIVDGKVTILIGANDHGKSNLLDAISRLNDDKKIEGEDRNWDLPESEIVKLQWHFIPSDSALEKIKSMEIVPPPVQEKTDVSVPADPSAPAVADVPKEECFPVNTTGEIVYYRDSKDNIVKVLSVPLQIPVSKSADILSLRPRVELFIPPTTNLVDQVNLSQLEQPDFEFMQGIFRIAGIWDVRQTIFSQNDKNAKILNQASEVLTNMLNDRWNQGKNLKWKLEHTGTNGDHIVIRIQDPSIDSRFTRPSLRSSGFRTYFLLSMITSARAEKYPSNAYIYLFDEPGTYLHPHAQLDLQRSFEAIAEKTQIIYTTHSLFLINKNYPDRNRVISKTKAGTKIDQKPFTKNWKSVRESLGILLSNNFLIAEKTLLVEGPSDIIYILDAIKKLKFKKIVDIDLNDFSVVDAGNSKNYLAMAKLMLCEGRDVVALLDGDQAGIGIENNLKKICEKEIENKRLQINKLSDKKSVEDIFPDLEILKTAISNGATYLSSSGLRKLKAQIDISAEINKINYSTVDTLGKVIVEKTASLFEPEEEISKLSIALEYENISKLDGSTPSAAIAELGKIKEFLNLRGERAAEGGVFEEV